MVWSLLPLRCFETDSNLGTDGEYEELVVLPSEIIPFETSNQR